MARVDLSITPIVKELLMVLTLFSLIQLIESEVSWLFRIEMLEKLGLFAR